MVRVLSFTITAFVVAVIFAVVGMTSALRLRMSTEYSYRRALSELSAHVDSIDLALQKSCYASTPSELVGLCSQIWSDSSAAKTDISQMPMSDIDLGATTKFLSHSGDWANTLAKKLASSQSVSADDRKTINTLTAGAKKLSAELSGVQTRLQSGDMTLFKSDSVMRAANVSSIKAVATVGDGFTNIERSFTGLPSMIYDGPFSDSVNQKTPQLVKSLPDVGREKARADAASFLGVRAGELKQSGDGSGTLPTYGFTCGSKCIYVSKRGGYTVRMLDSCTAGKETLSRDEACRRAAQYISERGIGSMTQTYYLKSNGVAEVNFAYGKGGVVCYPDLVKVGVCLSDGAIVSFDATGYIMNHTSRASLKPTVSEASVRSKLSSDLKVAKESVVVIPTDGGGEELCYEYRCTASDGRTVMDYFSAVNGVERKILILLDTPGGEIPS